MHLPQEKVIDRKNVINVPILCSGKEFDLYSEFNSLRTTGETFKGTANAKSTYNMAAVHAWINIDQLQANNIPTRLGFGRFESEESNKNGIWYTMDITEEGEGSYVKGNIVYNIVAVEVDGKKYTVKKGHKIPNGTEMATKYEFAYNGKSAKNSTLFKLVRRLIPNGLFQFDNVNHLIEMKPKATPKPKTTTKKPASVDIPKGKGKKGEESAQKAANA